MVDRSAQAVTLRLRRWAELSQDAPARPAVDMSAPAVTARLRELAEVSALCLRLAAIGRDHALTGR
ncbi:MAG: hypothetical protein WKG00_37580 [Polyangiaceae bacterium]